jgi:hypothetical protein
VVRGLYGGGADDDDLEKEGLIILCPGVFLRGT